MKSYNDLYHDLDEGTFAGGALYDDTPARMTAAERISAYNEGYRNGQADRRMGHRSEYAWNYRLDPPDSYSAAYGPGYVDGWNNRD